MGPARHVNAITAVNYRQFKRNHDLKPPFPPDPDFERRAQVYLTGYKPPDWRLLEARLVAFADERIVTALPGRVWAKEAVAVADTADNSVIELIRIGLQGQSRQLGD